MEIKAIETVYRGYPFRSRTEARWALFFDQMGIKWEYEFEGYEYGRTRYLCDFKLFPYGCTKHVWAEIKGRPPTEKEVEKVAVICDETEDNVGGVIFEGSPGHNAPLIRPIYYDESIYDRPLFRTAASHATALKHGFIDCEWEMFDTLLWLDFYPWDYEINGRVQITRELERIKDAIYVVRAERFGERCSA